MRYHINAARQETSPVLEEAFALTTQKEEVETMQRLLDAFNKHFIVDDEELSTLTSSSEPVNDQFFQALGRSRTSIWKIRRSIRLFAEHYESLRNGRLSSKTALISLPKLENISCLTLSILL